MGGVVGGVVGEGGGGGGRTGRDGTAHSDIDRQGHCQARGDVHVDVDVKLRGGGLFRSNRIGGGANRRRSGAEQSY